MLVRALRGRRQHNARSAAEEFSDQQISGVFVAEDRRF